MKLLIASAIKTPLMPINFGKITVQGATMITFLKIEKKMACFDFPKPTAVDCPTI